MRQPEDLIQNAHQAVSENFLAKYGIEHYAAAGLFQDGSAIAPMLQHMYFEAMEELRECGLKENGERIQGQAQILWTLMNIPEELKKLNELDV